MKKLINKIYDLLDLIILLIMKPTLSSVARDLITQIDRDFRIGYSHWVQNRNVTTRDTNRKDDGSLAYVVHGSSDHGVIWDACTMDHGESLFLRGDNRKIIRQIERHYIFMREFKIGFFAIHSK